MGAAAPFIIPALMMGGQAVIGHGQERRARHAQEDAYTRWEETAYPSAEAIGERRETGMGKMGEARSSAYENLARNLSTRGFGPGSGLMKKGAGGIEKGYLKGVSGLESELTKFQHTPMFSPPGQTYTGGGGSDALSQAMGMMMAWSMLQGGGFGGGGASTSTPWARDF